MLVLKVDGYQILANYRDQYILAKAENLCAPEPFVVWALDGDGDPHTGSYFTSKEPAEKEFAERCFAWFGDLLEELQKEENPEQRVDFTQVYQTHRVGFYKGWMVVETQEGEIRTYYPIDGWDEFNLADLEHINDTFEPEWTGDCYREIIDFINDY